MSEVASTEELCKLLNLAPADRLKEILIEWIEAGISLEVDDFIRTLAETLAMED